MEQFFLPFAGGVLIGFSALILLLLNGRILGVSGIVGGVFKTYSEDRVWRLSSLLGFLSGGALMYKVDPAYFVNELDLSFSTIAIAGLLVGFGTQLGSGCTSGHGVCGLSRFSYRSLVATCCFMLSGVLTVYLMRVL